MCTKFHACRQMRVWTTSEKPNKKQDHTTNIDEQTMSITEQNRV